MALVPSFSAPRAPVLVMLEILPSTINFGALYCCRAVAGVSVQDVTGGNSPDFSDICRPYSRLTSSTFQTDLAWPIIQ